MPLRPYDQDHIFLLPPSLNELVRQDHPVRVFSEIIDRIDTKSFREPKEEGRPAYHPKMMIKALLWGYTTGVRSSRKIEEKLIQDIMLFQSDLDRISIKKVGQYGLDCQADKHLNINYCWLVS